MEHEMKNWLCELHYRFWRWVCFWESEIESLVRAAEAYYSRDQPMLRNSEERMQRAQGSRHRRQRISARAHPAQGIGFAAGTRAICPLQVK